MKAWKVDMTKQQSKNAILVLLVFFLAVLGIAMGMGIKNTVDMRTLLEDSVKSELISVSIAARESIDVDAFVEYGDESVADLPQYRQTLTKLRQLCSSVGAEYIYALKKVGNEYVFVFDTDLENDEIFIPYEISSVHEEAFTGKNSADILNVQDEYGTFNTGAVPLFKDGKVVGIVSTDFSDTYIGDSYQKAVWNFIVLVTVLIITMGVMLVLVIMLLNRLRAMQQRLEHMAHYDGITGLPNRQYLLEFLEKETNDPAKNPFALFFIDLDNFKRVNDNAGHDAGDELLRNIAAYLNRGANENAKSFRPSAGILNIAARVGGDEFVQVIRGVSTREEAERLAQSLLDGFVTQHTSRYVDKYGVGLSVGVALFPYHTPNFHVLIKYADIAMYAAKNAGKNQFCFYEDEMNMTE